MSKSEEKRAKSFEKALKNGKKRHDPSLVPFMEVSKSLQRASEADTPDMDSEVMARQRETLMNKSEEIKPAHDKSAKEQAVASKAKLQAIKDKLRDAMSNTWTKTLVPVGVVAIIVAIILTTVFPRGPQSLGPSIPRQIADLIIPAAYAADAFTFEAEIEDAAGASTTTTFLIESKIDLSADKLSKHIVIVQNKPDPGSTESKLIGVEVEKVDENKFRVTPTETLNAGATYRVEIHAAVDLENGGELQARTFSWAIQTQDVFRVLSSVPGDQANRVPIDTGIEVTVNMERWEDPSSHFKIVPDVEGRFDIHGRSVAFVPKENLAYGTTYTVTWSKDWGLKDSELTLKEDYVIQFETISQQRAEASNKRHQIISARYPYIARAPGNEIRIPVSKWIYDSERNAVTIEGYTLTRDQAVEYLERDKRRPWFCMAKREKAELEQEYATQLGFTATSTVEKAEWRDALSMPDNIDTGYYLVKLTSQDNLSTWFFLNITNTAVYINADKDTTVVWAMHATDERPLANISITDGTQKVKTDAKGIARLKTPEALKQTKEWGEDLENAVILVAGEGNDAAVVPLSQQYDFREIYWGWGPITREGIDRTVSYLHHDRPLYRTSDTAEISGMIQDRESGIAPTDPITVQLTQGCDMWWCNPNPKVLGEITVTPDKQGFFKTSLTWSNVTPRFYTIILKRGNYVVRSVSIEIRNYVKPAYTLEATVDRKELFAGDKITGVVRSAFYEGTPMPNLKLRINNEEYITDEDGQISFAFDTVLPPCNVEQNHFTRCSQTTTKRINVLPVEAEETASLSTTVYATVWNTNVQLIPDWKTEFDDDTAKTRVKALRIELPRAKDSAEKPIKDLTVSASVLEEWWERIELEEPGYDPVEKKTYPRYRYEKRSNTVAELESKTDKDGYAEFSFPTIEGRSYKVHMRAKDSKGRWSTAYRSVYRCQRCQYRPSTGRGSSFVSIAPLQQRESGSYNYRLGEEVSIGLFRDEELLPRKSGPSYMFLTATAGITDVIVSNEASITFPYADKHVPNVRIVGVCFEQGGFRDYSYDVYFDPTDRELTLELTSDRERYAPGNEATISVRLKDKNGKAKANARVSLAVVDEALFDATYRQVNENALGAIYTHVSSGIIFYTKSHYSDADIFTGGGGAEMGGGGEEPIRKNFKDTAAYDVVTTNSNGEAELKFKLPDNITSWRVSGIGISPDRYAGTARTNINVSKQAFVNVVVPETFLASDKPQIKIRAYGRAIETGEAITYSVNAPSLGIENAQIQSKAGESAYLPIENPVPGSHSIVIAMKSESGSDAMEKKVNVLESRFERDEGVLEEVTTETTLDPGTATEIRVSFVPRTRAQFLSQLNRLRWSWSQRVEAKIASDVASKLLIDYFGEDVERKDPALFLNYQKSDGGIAILPHASSELSVSARVAFVQPNLFDRVALAEYLKKQLEKKDTPRESQIEALAGLAALGEPVLLDLRVIAELEDLTWREQLAVMRGLAAVGDLEAARPHLEAMLEGHEEEYGQIMVEVSDEEFENKEVTAELAALAIRLADTRAAALREAVLQTYVKTAFTPLSDASFLQAVVPAAIGMQADVTYEVNGDRETIELSSGWPVRVHLTADEARSFKIMETTAPAELTYLRRVTTKPVNDPNVIISRRYIQNGQTAPTTLKDGGDAVLVELKVEFTGDAPKGCYTVRDHVPAGVSAMTYTTYYRPSNTSYVSPFEAENPTFIVCKDWNHTITYNVKPSAKGTFTAEPAVVQSMRYPEATSISDEQVVTIE